MLQGNARFIFLIFLFQYLLLWLLSLILMFVRLFIFWAQVSLLLAYFSRTVYNSDRGITLVLEISSSEAVSSNGS